MEVVQSKTNDPIQSVMCGDTLAKYTMIRHWECILNLWGIEVQGQYIARDQTLGTPLVSCPRQSVYGYHEKKDIRGKPNVVGCSQTLPYITALH